MGQGFVKIKDKYFEWSTIVDAPVTYGMSADELRSYVQSEYGRTGLDLLPSRLERLEATGTSFHGMTVKEVLANNRAGENEKCITANQIYTRYTK